MSRYLDEDLERAGALPAEVDESDKTMSLGSIARGDGLDEVELDYQSMGGGSRLLNRSTLLIVGSMVIAAVTLYAMRASQGDLTSGDDVRKSEADVAQLMAQLSKREQLPNDHVLAPGNIDNLFRTTDEILTFLHEDPTSHQVPVQKVKQNPFVLFTEKKPDEPAKPVLSTSEAEAKRKRELLLASLHKEVASLRVSSVINGATPVAVINNELYQPGATLGSFRVKSIKGVTVTLEAEGETFTLMLGDADDKPSGKRR